MCMVICAACDRFINTDTHVEDVAMWEPEVICTDCYEAEHAHFSGLATEFAPVSRATGVARSMQEYLKFAKGKPIPEVMERVADFMEEFAMALSEQKK